MKFSFPLKYCVFGAFTIKHADEIPRDRWPNYGMDRPAILCQTWNQGSCLFMYLHRKHDLSTMTMWILWLYRQQNSTGNTYLSIRFLKTTLGCGFLGDPVEGIFVVLEIAVRGTNVETFAAGWKFAPSLGQLPTKHFLTYLPLLRICNYVREDEELGVEVGKGVNRQRFSAVEASYLTAPRIRNLFWDVGISSRAKRNQFYSD